MRIDGMDPCVQDQGRKVLTSMSSVDDSDVHVLQYELQEWPLKRVLEGLYFGPL